MRTKSELVAAVSAASGLSKGDTEAALEAFRDVIENEMANGSGELLWPRVGRFYRQTRAPRTISTPMTGGERRQIPETRIVRFSPSATLKELVR
ncbi:hypothetical protein VP06_14640 [Methylobacterium aquaticum]|uniref:Uncharacterized protein n=1 Tax=Methylobacterium aquaticum TaxID=270351 RepID=A0A0J6SGF0_9HYPH|nr:hypothetical protein VP06_14640 [Methylobacterium aquaticum]